MTNQARIWLNPESNRSLFIPLERPSIDLSPRKLHMELGAECSPFKCLPISAKEPSLWIKDESARFGLPSFKILGASWGVFMAICAKLDLMDEVSILTVSKLSVRIKAYIAEYGQKSMTIWAATDGNHGRAVSWMATKLGIKAMIIVPDYLDPYTRKAISDSGGLVIPVPMDYDGAVSEAADRADVTSGILVQDTSWQGYDLIPNTIVDGYSTIFEEIEAEFNSNATELRPLDETDLVIVPVGVGSLALAAVRSMKHRNKPVKVATVEPDTAACLNTSLHAGTMTTVTTKDTIMTGMNCGTVSLMAWKELKTTIDISLVVSDQQADAAVHQMEELGINAGPCGAACYAAYAILRERGLLEGINRVIIINTEARRPYTLKR